MQPIESYNNNLGTAILLVGPAGAGKTSLGLSLFPKTYALVGDLNFKSGLDHLRRRNLLANVVGFDMIQVDETGKTVPIMQRYDRMFACLTKESKNPEVDALFLDSAMFFEDVIKAKICGAANEMAIKLTGYDQWGLLALTWKSLIMQCRQSGKKLIMAAHEEKQKDASDQIFKYNIAIDGQMAGKFPALFSDVLRCVVKDPIGPGQKPTWIVQPVSNVRQEHLKNSMALDSELLQDDLVKKVREVTK